MTGSQQRPPPAYVASRQPGALAKPPIALEDVRPGSGELVYYDGSHRLDDFLFSGQYKCWHHERDGAGQHDEYAVGLVPRAEAAGLERRRLLVERGDVLIWSGNLAHGGGEVTDESLSRRSLVGHYCPEWAVPRSFDQFPGGLPPLRLRHVRHLTLRRHHGELRSPPVPARAPVPQRQQAGVDSTGFRPRRP